MPAVDHDINKYTGPIDNKSCFGCRLTGLATGTGIGLYLLLEAKRQGRKMLLVASMFSVAMGIYRYQIK